MFESLTIRNFQKHRKLVIEFDKHVTTIVGPNDIGKSTILRAIRWVCSNRPLGRAFIRHGAKLVSVTLLADKRFTITRSVGNRGGLYKLNGKRFKAFRGDVPKEIANSLGISDINFQRHHESVFWFSLSPGQLARELNKLVDLDTIDQVQSEIAKHVRDTQAELKVCEKRLSQAMDALGRLRWAKRLDVKMGNLDVKMRRYRLKSLRMARLRDAIGAAVVQRGYSRSMAVAAANGATLGAIGAAATAAADRSARLASIIERLAATGLRASNWTLGQPSIVLKKHKQVNHLQSLVSKLEEQEQLSWQSKRKLQKQKELLEEKLDGRCPLCGTILSDKSLI